MICTLLIPILWMTSCLHIVASNRQRTQSDKSVVARFDIMAYINTDSSTAALDWAESDIHDFPIIMLLLCSARLQYDKENMSNSLKSVFYRKFPIPRFYSIRFFAKRSDPA